MVSVFDRSYLYGDSVYEVLRIYERRPFLLDAHLTRLWNSARLCRMKPDQTLEQLRSEVLKTLEAHYSGPAAEDAYCRIVVSRGEGKIGFGTAQLTSPTLFTIIVLPLPPLPSELRERGYRLKIVERLRNHPQALNPAMKSGNYLNNLLAYLEATQSADGEPTGFDDAILRTHDGFIAEGSTFNIFYARRGIIATPPTGGMLEGLTRSIALRLARDAGIPVREVHFPRERLYEADEVFLTSTLREVQPVTQVDEIRIGTGRPGPLTRKLQQSYETHRRTQP